MTRRIPIVVVLPPRTLLLDVAGPIEVLRYAGSAQEKVAFDVSYVGPRAALRSSIGLHLARVGKLPKRLPADAVVVLAGAASGPPDPDVEAAEAEIVAWLRVSVRPGCLVISICAGALLAARAGLLDGYVCTTHHSCCEQLAREAPSARVLENRLFVEDRDRICSAGETAGIDLMLHLVSVWAGPAAALGAARELVAYPRRGPDDPQLPRWLEGRSHLHAAVHRAQDAIAADPARDWSLESLAQTANVSARHLRRLFAAHAGMTVTDAVGRARVVAARELVGSTRLDMESVAERTGFASARHMRRVWGRFHEVTPARMRRGKSDGSARNRRVDG
jgi:transcriptional regulator GlxA family with amidase domain